MSGRKRIAKDVFWDVIFLIVAFIWCIPVLIFAACSYLLSPFGALYNWIRTEIKTAKIKKEKPYRCNKLINFKIK